MKKTCESRRCMDKSWLTSEEAFSIYAPCMYQPAYEDYKSLMEKYFSDPSVKIFVCDMDGEKTGILVMKEIEAAEGSETGAEAEILGIAQNAVRDRIESARKTIMEYYSAENQIF